MQQSSILITIKNFFSEIKCRPYYYVPPCPECNSPITGQYMKLHRETDTEWQINEALRHGELIKALNTVPDRNCFCVNCGHEWFYSIDLALISTKELNIEREKRLTAEILNKRIEEQRELEKHQFSLFKPLKKFIGKL